MTNRTTALEQKGVTLSYLSKTSCYYGYTAKEMWNTPMVRHRLGKLQNTEDKLGPRPSIEFWVKYVYELKIDRQKT